MSLEEFEKLTVTFHADENPMTQKAIDLSFSRNSFVETDLPLF